MDREYELKVLHVLHVIVDGVVDGDTVERGFPDRLQEAEKGGALHVNAITETFWHLHYQLRTAWGFEVDRHLFKEKF